MLLHICSRREELDAERRHLRGDRAEDRLGVALLQPCEEEERFEIRAQVEEVARVDLARHHRAPDTGFFEKPEHLPELADPHPLDPVHELRQGRIGLPGESGGHDPRDARSPRRARHSQRVGAIAGDDCE